jgi:hypothetical protein
MKKIYLGALALAVGFSATAQSKIGATSLNVRTSKGTTPKSVSLTSEAYLKAKKSATWSEDFSNGFAGQGSNGAWTQDAALSSKGTKPEWEYRGESTTPDITTGSRGSCVGTRGPLESTTSFNGFMIFDSNFWDEPLPDGCAGTGSGEAPSPHDATLYTPSIDFSSETSVQLFFETYSRNFQGEVRIDVIADGDTSKNVGELFSLLDLGVNTATGNGDVVGIDITNWAAGHSDVKVGINFNGDYYFVMIDDLFFDAVPDYDYSLESVWNDDITEWFEYYDLPLNQSHVLAPGMTIMSRGALPVDLTMEITITEPNGNVQGPFTKVFANYPKDSLSASTYLETFKPTLIGEHTISYKVTSDFDDQDFSPNNNTAERKFNITEDLWSDAFTGPTASYYGAPDDAGTPDNVEFFQLYYTYAEAEVTGTDFLLFNDPNTPDEDVFEGDEFEVRLYSVDTAYYFANQVAEKDLAYTRLQTTTISVEESMITQGLGVPLIPVTALFDEATTIAPDNVFAVSVFNSGGGFYRPAVTLPNDNPDGSSTISSLVFSGSNNIPFTQTVRFSNVNAWQRARVEPFISVSENELASQIGDAAPNPAKGNVTVAYSLLNTSNVSMTLTDLSGKVILTQNEGTKNAGNNKLTFDVSNLEAGVYFYSVNVDGTSTTKKLVVTK